MPSRAESAPIGADAAVEAALRLLRHRDRSAARVDHELTARGFGVGDREEALATLQRTGVVDDTRFAEQRVGSLAERGAGDALIRHDLEAAGVGHDVVEDALAGLELEHERARRVVERRGASPKTARYLAGKGFSNDAIHTVIARAGDEPLG